MLAPLPKRLGCWMKRAKQTCNTVADPQIARLSLQGTVGSRSDLRTTRSVSLVRFASACGLWRICPVLRRVQCTVSGDVSWSRVVRQLSLVWQLSKIPVQSYGAADGYLQLNSSRTINMQQLLRRHASLSCSTDSYERGITRLTRNGTRSFSILPRLSF